MSRDDEPIKTRVGAAGDPMFDALFAMMDAMREASTPLVETFSDPRDGISALMSAAATFAGVQAGTLLAMGALKQQDRRRVGETALTNFRQGIDFGLSRAMRLATDEFGGNA